MKDRYDVVVIGAGPGGLMAAITLGREGQDVLLVD
ncbi:MAG: NAD(P)/FAD-dependent oxidoreductase, partial [Thermodesulfobacteriota bacterium]|nr:NAD(P)/FAD-dependent oxidoreductase [Thermodesulfobacteriota bacterium]